MRCMHALLEQCSGVRLLLHPWHLATVLTSLSAMRVSLQGRDKVCILISFVRSNDNEAAGALLADWRRINVAITRARHKLILIGSGSTLRSVPMLRHLLDIVKLKDMHLQLPLTALS